MVALRGLTVLPQMIMHFDISRKKSIAAVEKAMVGDQKVLLVTQKQTEEMESAMLRICIQMGTIAMVKQLVKLPGGVIRVMVEGLERAELLISDMPTAPTWTARWRSRATEDENLDAG